MVYGGAATLLGIAIGRYGSRKTALVAAVAYTLTVIGGVSLLLDEGRHLE